MKPNEPKRAGYKPLAGMAMGKVLKAIGKKRGDLTMIHRGQKHLDEANAVLDRRDRRDLLTELEPNRNNVSSSLGGDRIKRAEQSSPEADRFFNEGTNSSRR